MQIDHGAPPPELPAVDDFMINPGKSDINGPTAAASPVEEFLKRLYQDCRQLNDGAVATYIPELAKANPDWFGICLVTCTGSVYEIGDSQQPFTIQSISKPFVYGMALEDEGRAKVLEKVGVEPTGDAFNSISLDQGPDALAIQ